VSADARASYRDVVLFFSNNALATMPCKRAVGRFICFVEVLGQHITAASTNGVDSGDVLAEKGAVVCLLPILDVTHVVRSGRRVDWAQLPAVPGAASAG
jgi:hypothetical protein